MAAKADDPSGIPLRLTAANSHDLTLKPLDNGEVEIKTTGTDPYLFTEPFDTPPNLKQNHVLAFEYFSTPGTDHFQVFLIPPLSEANSIKAAGLSNSQGWSSYVLDLQPVLSKPGGNIRQLRLDFGSEAGKTIHLRALLLRPPTEQEIQLAARRTERAEADRLAEEHLRDYLQHVYPCKIDQVSVEDSQIRVQGQVAKGKDNLFLAEAPLWVEVTELKAFPALEPIHAEKSGKFSMVLSRVRKEGEQETDRLLSRWLVVEKTEQGFALLSHARYADTVQSRYNLPEEKPRTKKGIGGLSVGRPLEDLDALGISSATVNILLNGLFSSAPGPGKTPFTYHGQTWYSDDRAVSRLDATLQEAAKRHIVVSAIILVGQPKDSPAGSFSKLVAYPDADPSGIFVMPDVASREGVEAYGAALDFLAQRYSRPDNQYGRIHHWILHNEINAGWIWTNAGDKTALQYMDLYQKSMRMAHLIARQYNPHAQVFISLEHHWTKPAEPKFYAGSELLDLLAEFSAAEGDFDWAVAFHPYPQNLFEPRVWNDNEAVFTFTTPKITYKNLEVLEAFMQQPGMRYRGKSLRAVHLTEQGLNSPDYSEKSLQDQAAGMAYAWNKIKASKVITVFDYHNWVDNRGEGGLRIGLRKFPNEPGDPLGKKPIWFVYQALGTPDEEKVTDPCKAVIGIHDWREIRHTEKIQ